MNPILETTSAQGLVARRLSLLLSREEMKQLADKLKANATRMKQFLHRS